MMNLLRPTDPGEFFPLGILVAVLAIVIGIVLEVLRNTWSARRADRRERKMNLRAGLNLSQNPVACTEIVDLELSERGRSVAQFDDTRSQCIFHLAGPFDDWIGDLFLLGKCSSNDTGTSVVLRAGIIIGDPEMNQHMSQSELDDLTILVLPVESGHFCIPLKKTNAFGTGEPFWVVLQRDAESPLDTARGNWTLDVLRFAQTPEWDGVLF